MSTTNSDNTANTSTPSAKTPAPAVPAYVTFCRAMLERCEALGLEPDRADTESGLPQNAGYCFLRFSSGAATIVPKSKTRMAPLQLHVEAAGLPGFIALPKPNGRVICHFEADLDLWAEHVLPRLPGASKRPVAAAVRALSESSLSVSVLDEEQPMHLLSGLSA